MMGIYQITNIKNNRIYIGSSKNIFKRWEEHITDLKYNTHHSYKLQEDWNKFGVDNFTFKILEFVNDKNKLKKIEQKWLDRINIENEYNVMSYTDYKGISRARDIHLINWRKDLKQIDLIQLATNLLIFDRQLSRKVNKLGLKRYDLSKSWFTKYAHQEQTALAMLNVSHNFLHTLDKDKYWTTFVSMYNPISIRGRGFRKCFVPLNGEVGESKKRNYLYFVANCFPNSFKQRELEQKGIKIDSDEYAVSILLEWIVGVADITKPINIYIPSLRMENLLKQWINKMMIKL